MKKFRFIYKSFIFAFIITLLGFFSYSQESERTTINIENARNTKYEKDKETGNDIIVLTGDVKISVTKSNSKNVINADSVRYDRTTEMIYAEGNVSLEQTTENSGGQTVTASSLMFNTSTLEGVFDDGRAVQTKSDALNLPSGSTLIVASDIFGRSESNTISFKDGELTFCDDEDPHWRIKASRIWLLPGGEFAFLNARVFVGPVPTFYLPAFYYPKDELIFNPVFGYEKRRGYYINTTAYLFGRKPLDTTTTTTSSTDSDASEKLKALFNFVKPSTLKEQKHEGLLLHNLDADYKGNTTNYVKLMGDYYSNMGYMIGLDGVVKPPKYITDFQFKTQLGFTNTVFKDGTVYMPYAPSGEKIMDKSNLLGFELPFRYSTNLKFTVSNPFSFSLSMPIYSDPFFSNDFNDRYETMDWISYLINSASTDDDEDTTTTNEISSFTWTLSSSYSAPLPTFIKPYISTLSMSLNSSLVFSTMNVSTDNLTRDDITESDLASWRSYTPERKFYYPSQITPATVSGTLSGTILDLSSTRTKASKASKASKTPTFASNLAVPDDFLTEEQKAKAKEDAEKADSEEDGKEVESSNDETEDEKFYILPSFLPIISTSSSSITDIPGAAFTMKYSIKPSLTTQIVYSSTNLKTADDFEWDVLKSSMYTFKLPINLDNNFSYAGSFFTMSNSNAFNPVWQEHPYIHINADAVKDEEGNTITAAETAWYSESQAASLKKTDYAAQKRDLTSTNSVALKPFYYITPIKDTGITWRNTLRIIRTEFLSDEYDAEKDNPEWEYHMLDWGDEESVTTNALDYTFATNQMDGKFSQSFTFSQTLKPLAENYYGTLKFTFPLTSYTIETGVKKSSTDDDAEWVKQPLKQTLSVSGKVLNSTMSGSASYNYNLEDDYNDSLKFSFSWMNLTASYQMSYTIGYDMTYTDSGAPNGWQAKTEKEFMPYSFSLSYSPSTKTLYTWKNRVSLVYGLSTSVTADLLKPTSSSFTFSPSLTFKINEFVSLTFSSTTKNNVIYRYFGNEYNLPGEENMLVDLLDSFRFDDEDKRKGSGFKLKSLNCTITHDLHDWDFNATFKVEPRLVTEDNQKYYDFNPYITLSITWRPMSAMKTEIIDKYGEWQLK